MRKKKITEEDYLLSTYGDLINYRDYNLLGYQLGTVKPTNYKKFMFPTKETYDPKTALNCPVFLEFKENVGVWLTFVEELKLCKEEKDFKIVGNKIVNFYKTTQVRGILLTLMQAVYYTALKLSDDPYMTKMTQYYWNGIGDWQA